jgi:hypothetical protein
MGEIWPEAQSHVATELGSGDPSAIVFASNTHDHIIRLVAACPRRPDKPLRVLTSDGEFHSARRQMTRWAEGGDISLFKVAAEPFDDFSERFEREAGSGEHDLIMVSQVLFNSGRLFDLIADLAALPRPEGPWVVLTDEPGEFQGLPVRAIKHQPTGPMAIDFGTRSPAMGIERGEPAYHDKRFALQAALEEFETAIFIDADTRVRALPRLPVFRAGIAVTKVVNASIAEHLSRWGAHRSSAFEKLGVELTGDVEVIKSARWCSEALFAITKDGNEGRFFEAWGRGAEFLLREGQVSGEGGVIGLAAACAGWTVDYKTLSKLARSMRHEGGGPKSE